MLVILINFLHTIIFFFKVFICAYPRPVCLPERQHLSPLACEVHCITAKLPYLFLTSKISRAAELRAVLFLHHWQAITHRAVYRLALCSLSQ